MLPEGAIELYLHYKGGVYRLIDSGVKHSETGEDMVLYKNGHGELFVRPSEMFFESVVVDGVEVPRFKYLGIFYP